MPSGHHDAPAGPAVAHLRRKVDPHLGDGRRLVVVRQHLVGPEGAAAGPRTAAARQTAGPGCHGSGPLRTARARTLDRGGRGGRRGRRCRSLLADGRV